MRRKQNSYGTVELFQNHGGKEQRRWAIPEILKDG